MSPTKNEFSHSINSSTPKPQTMDNTKFSRFENQSCQKLMSDKVSEVNIRILFFFSHLHYYIHTNIESMRKMFEDF